MLGVYIRFLFLPDADVLGSEVGERIPQSSIFSIGDCDFAFFSDARNNKSFLAGAIRLTRFALEAIRDGVFPPKYDRRETSRGAV